MARNDFNALRSAIPAPYDTRVHRHTTLSISTCDPQLSNPPPFPSSAFTRKNHQAATKTHMSLSWMWLLVRAAQGSAEAHLYPLSTIDRVPKQTQRL